jgi:hypothetical protein
VVRGRPEASPVIFRTLPGIVAALALLAAPFGIARQGPTPSAPGNHLAVWIHDTSQWRRYRHLDRLKLDESVRLAMSVGDTRTLLPVVHGSTVSSNLYIDLCVPVDTFYVTETLAWRAVDPEEWDCARYSSYIPGGDGRSVRSPREPLHFRALAAGTFLFRYRIVTPETGVFEGAFQVVVAPS